MNKYIQFQGFLPCLVGFKYSDKVTHALYGSVVGIIVALVSTPSIGLWVVVVLGMAKEAYDKYVRKVFWDIWDIVATSATSLIILSLSYLFN